MQIDFLSLRVSNLREMVAFYSGKLGFPLLAMGPDYGVLRAGSTVLMFEKSESEGSPYYHFAFDVPQNQISDAEIWLSERVELLKRDSATQISFKAWNATAIYFHDPAGNIVEFIARHNLENEASQPFGANSILRVSEIGWPCLAGNPDRDFQLPTWDESEGFRAFGTETGLILAVDTKREWLPTNRRAEAHPVTIVITDENGTREYIRS